MTDSREPPDGAASVATARERLAATATPVDRTETLPVSTAVGRVLVEAVDARRPVPPHRDARVDGFALRATAVAEATADAPVSLGVRDGVGPDTRSVAPLDGASDDHPAAVRVDAGDPVPEGADAVVPRSAADTSIDGSILRVAQPVESDANVRPVGADVEAGATVLDAGHRLGPSDPALCSAVGRTRVEVVQRPTVGVVPVGDGLAGGAPDDAETVDTDGATLAALVERWGGKVTYRDPVETDPYALRAAVQRDLTKDLLVTTGGTSDGHRDRIPEIVDELGEISVSGVGLDPGGSARVGVVSERPVVALPGEPVACLVAAVQLVGPAVTRLAHRSTPSYPTTAARLTEAVDSESGVRTVVPVALGDSEDQRETATPISGPEHATAPLATIARADGWVVADGEGVEAGETVTVERWEDPV